jgi:hypothetical protein
MHPKKDAKALGRTWFVRRTSGGNRGDERKGQFRDVEGHFWSVRGRHYVSRRRDMIIRQGEQCNGKAMNEYHLEVYECTL